MKNKLARLCRWLGIKLTKYADRVLNDVRTDDAKKYDMHARWRRLR